MKITLEFEHSHELIDLLKSLGSNLKKDEPSKVKVDNKPIFEFYDEFKNEHS